MNKEPKYPYFICQRCGYKCEIKYASEDWQYYPRWSEYLKCPQCGKLTKVFDYYV